MSVKNISHSNLSHDQVPCGVLLRSSNNSQKNLHSFQGSTYQPGSINEERACYKCHVVSRIETVPEGAQRKHCHGTVQSLVHRVAEPLGSHDVPVVQQHF